MSWEKRFFGPMIAAAAMIIPVLATWFNWFELGPFFEHPLTAWAAFLGTVSFTGGLVYLIALFSPDSVPAAPASDAEKHNGSAGDPERPQDD